MGVFWGNDSESVVCKDSPQWQDILGFILFVS